MSGADRVTGPEMVHVPAGGFLMGTTAAQIRQLAANPELARAWTEAGHFQREQPAGEVALPAFFIARHPVTVGVYRAFIAAGGYRDSRWWTAAGWAWRAAAEVTQPDHWDDPRWTGDDRLPVVGVSWYEAVAYGAWLAGATGEAYRLPSEAEWEKAARGTGGRLFPWGDTFEPECCNVRASGIGHTVPVGSYRPAGDSPYGCADMVGNVSEWVLSRFAPYPYDPADGREDPAGEAERVTRGGSWHSPVMRARTAARGLNDPFFRDADLGFRVARGAQ